MTRLGFNLLSAATLAACSPDSSHSFPPSRPDTVDTAVDVDTDLPVGSLEIHNAAMGVLAPESPFWVDAQGDQGRVSVRVDLENTGKNALDIDSVQFDPACLASATAPVSDLYEGNVVTVACTVPATDGIEIRVQYNELGELRQASRSIASGIALRDCAVKGWLADAWLRDTANFISTDDPLGVGPYDWVGMQNALSQQALQLPVFEDDLSDGDCASAPDIVSSAVAMRPSTPLEVNGPCDMDTQQTLTGEQWTLRAQYNAFAGQGFALGDGCPLDEMTSPQAERTLAFLEGVYFAR